MSEIQNLKSDHNRELAILEDRLNTKNKEILQKSKEISDVKNRIKIFQRKSEEQKFNESKIDQKLFKLTKIKDQEEISEMLDQIENDVIVNNKIRRENLVELKLLEFIEK
jgi:predicted  nucleic acid-binding Zn-ribbon protein